MTITSEQQIAIDFFNENQQYVESFGLMNLDREERLLYRKGKSLTAQQVVKSAPKKVEFYTDVERSFIAVAYDKGMNRQTIVKEFQQEFGNAHTASSIGQKVEMCKSIDGTLKNHKNFQFRDTELLEILQDIDSARYVLNWYNQYHT